MRKTLADLIDNTIVFQYKLPNCAKGIDKTILSTNEDSCYASTDFDDFVSIIYNLNFRT